MVSEDHAQGLYRRPQCQRERCSDYALAGTVGVGSREAGFVLSHATSTLLGLPRKAPAVLAVSALVRAVFELAGNRAEATWAGIKTWSCPAGPIDAMGRAA